MIEQLKTIHEALNSMRHGNAHAKAEDAYFQALAALDQLEAMVPQQAGVVHRYVLELPKGEKRQAKVFWSECNEADGEITHHLCISVDTAPQQAEAVPSDVVRDAEWYRWLLAQPYQTWKRIGWNLLNDGDPEIENCRKALIALIISKQRS